MQPKAITRRTGTMAVVGALLTSSALLSSGVQPAVADPVSVQTKISNLTSPAVNAVFTEYTAKAKLGQPVFNDAAWRWFDRGIDKATRGELTPSARAVAEYALDHIAEHPTRYFTTVGKKRTVKMSQTYIGTAFLVDGSGHAITARHVVTPDAEIRSGFAADAAQQLAKSDSSALIRVLRKWDLSSGTKRDIRASVAAFDRAKVKLTVNSPKVSMLLGVAGAGGSRVGQALPAEVLYRSNPDNGVDVAVLRVRTSSDNLSSVKLATQVPDQGSTIYVNCFTADATWNKDMSAAAQLMPSTNAALITAVKPSTGGINLLQTDAPVGPGCSGGPAFNGSGEVVGIVVSGVASGQTYVQPVNLVTEALAGSGVDLKPSLTSERWQQALADYYLGFYSEALNEFKEVQSLDAGHAYVGKFIAECQTAITEGRDLTPKPKPSPSVSPMVVSVGVGALVLLLGGGALLLVLLRRRRAARSTPSSVTGPSDATRWPTDAPLDGGGVREASGTWADSASWSAPAESHAGPVPTSPTTSAEVTDPDAVPDDTPDTFPSWRAIDFEPVYPPVDSDTANR